MDLPFAVDSPDRRTSVHSNASSLVTASSQGSILHSSPEQSDFDQNTILASQQPDVVDFTYVNVDETEVNEVTDARDPTGEGRGDVLAVLLSGDTQEAKGESIVTQCEVANQAANRAFEAKQNGDLTSALSAHTEAAKIFRETAVRTREADASLSNSLLLLSQAQAKSALALKRFLKHHPDGLQRSTEGGRSDASSQKERLVATVRGALVTRNEDDISDSVFLGKATSSSSPPPAPQEAAKREPPASSHPVETNEIHNPVDEMMELERELRDMDMALEMGNSIMSLGTRTQNRLKHSTMEDGSFCMVPPGSSYMSSSLWASGINTPARAPAPAPGAGTAGVRARANRVQNIIDASTPAHPVIPAASSPQKNPHSAGLESSWWGNSSASASQALSSSIMSLGGRGAHGGGEAAPANTKQLMRLLDSIKTLGDENAALLREVEEAEAARTEAKATREQMKRFKVEYGKRFAALKSALEKFRKGYPENNNSGSTENPVTSSEYAHSASASEQIQRQEQTIRKLTAALKREKDESKKKDAALRKYESFYREVKARSAQKAAQRQRQAQRPNIPTSRVPR